MYCIDGWLEVESREQLPSSVELERNVRSLPCTMKGLALVETKSQIRAVNIKTKKEHIETPETSSGTYFER